MLILELPVYYQKVLSDIAGQDIEIIMITENLVKTSKLVFEFG